MSCCNALSCTSLHQLSRAVQHETPHLTDSRAGRLASSRLALMRTPEASALRSADLKLGAGAPAASLKGVAVTPRDRMAAAASTAYPRNAAVTGKGVHQPHEPPKQAASENVRPRQGAGAAEGNDWQAEPKQTSRSLSGAFAESAQGRVSQAAASPLYMSRSQRQSITSSQDDEKSQRRPMVPPSLTATPAMSELVYSLPVTPRSRSLADAGLPSARGTPALGAAESAGSAAGPRRPPFTPTKDVSGMQAAPALTTPSMAQDGESSPAAATAESSGSAELSSLAGAMAYTLSLSGQEPPQSALHDEQSAAAHSGSQPMCTYEGQSVEGSRRHTSSSYRSCNVVCPRGTDEVFPVSYSGFSSDMRAAANATADSLFRQAEASSADSSHHRHEDETASAQQADFPQPPESLASGVQHLTSPCCCVLPRMSHVILLLLVCKATAGYMNGPFRMIGLG